MSTFPVWLEHVRPGVHLGLHVLVPLTVAWVAYRTRWRTVVLWLWAGWLIDVDHLWATPIYVADRCSIGYHALHSSAAMVVYAALLFWPRTRLFAIGVWIHLALDALDCAWMRAGS